MTHRIAQLESELNKAKTSYSVIHFHDQLAKTQRLELHYRTKTKQVQPLHNMYFEGDTHRRFLGNAGGKDRSSLVAV